jgi:hypothetical protein
MDIDVSEEDQMHQAIAMSLGETSDKTTTTKTKEKAVKAEDVSLKFFYPLNLDVTLTFISSWCQNL